MAAPNWVEAAQSAADHHATEARQWADAADREEVAEPVTEHSREQVKRFAAVSQAHGLAAIATMLASGIVSTMEEHR